MKLREDVRLRPITGVGGFKRGQRIMRKYGTDRFLDAMPGQVYTCLGYKDEQHILLHEAPPESGGLLAASYVIADIETRRPIEGHYCCCFGCIGRYVYEKVVDCSCHKGHPPCSACTDNQLICDECGVGEEEYMAKVFKVGDIVKRTATSHQGSNGISESGREYKVLTSDSRHIGIFMHRDRKEEPEGACWVASNFELVKAKDEKVSKKNSTPVEYDIEDIPFSSLTGHRRTMVVKGWPWICKGCKSSAKTEEKAKRCCGSNRLLGYTEQPDHLWYSASKDEIMEIEHMIPIHLKAAIVKLRKEKEANSMYHMLGVLEAEADRRSLDI